MESLFYLSFSLADGIGPKTFELLLKKFGTAEKAWESSVNELKDAGLGPKTIDALNLFRNTYNPKEYIQKLEKNKIWYISQNDKEYPESLKKLPNPPIVVFGRGDKSCLSSPKTIGVVGARKVTSYGREVTEGLVADLVSYGFTIISGMALGVDAIAHIVCLENNGAAIAVLGNGVDLPFPRENQSLYQNIIEQGSAIISEYPPGTNPSKGSFPARNRIIAALSDGILITEAAEDSGSLITADWSLKLNKKVFAVPGPITSRMSDGTSRLLKQGAVLVQNTQDILNEFSLQFPSGQASSNKSKKINYKKMGLAKDEIKILKLLENEEMTVDELSKRVNYSVPVIMQILGVMEIKGIIGNINGRYRVI